MSLALSNPLFAVGLGRGRIPVLLMTVFAGVVDLLPALQHFRRVLGVRRIDRLGGGVMQAMSKSDPGLAVLINQCLDLVGLKLDALIVLFSRFGNAAARNLQKVRGFEQLKGAAANRGPLLGGVMRLLYLAFRGDRGRDGVPDRVRGRIDNAVHQIFDGRRGTIFGLRLLSRAGRAKRETNQSPKPRPPSHGFCSRRSHWPFEACSA